MKNELYGHMAELELYENINIFTGTQTDLSIVDIEALLKSKQKMEEKLAAKTWGVNKIRDDDQAVKFYTGLQSFAVFMWLFK